MSDGILNRLGHFASVLGHFDLLPNVRAFSQLGSPNWGILEKINIGTAIGNLLQNNRTAADKRMNLKEIDVIEKREEVSSSPSSSVLVVKKQNFVWKCCKIVGGLRFNPFHGVVKRVDKVIGQIDEGLSIGREGLQIGRQGLQFGREGLTWVKILVGLFGVSVVVSIGNLIMSRRQINPPPPPPQQ